MTKFPGFSKKIYITLGSIFLILALGIGFYTRVLTYDDFVSFGPDQIRDAEVYAQMRNGEWPALGPIAPVNDDLGFHLIPLYHYLIGIFTLASNNLNVQLLVNGIFSFLSIPLFVLLSYRLLENVKREKRFFLAGLGGLWLSIFVSDIVNANLAWNPSPMLFFIFLFFLLLDKINKVHDHITFIEHYLIWIALGIVTSFLISLHTWSMLTFLPIFLANCVYFSILYIKKEKGRKTIYPLIGIIYLLMFLSTYIISEINSSWENTHSMIDVFMKSSTGISSAWNVVLSRPFTNFMSMIERAYIIEPGYNWLALPFIAAIICFNKFNFKGNKFILWQLTLVVVVYSLAILNYSGEMKSRYQIILWFYPMILSLSALAYTPTNIFLKSFQILCTSTFIVVSIYFNWIYTNNFLSRVYGHEKLIDTDEMVSMLSSLPDNSKICYPWGVGYDYLPQFEFIEKYVANKNHDFLNTCKDGDYYIFLRNLPKVNADYRTRKNTKEVPSKYEPVLEGTSYTVYKTN